MAWTGEAQVTLDGSVNLLVSAMSNGRIVARQMMEIDSDHIAGQIKSDFLRGHVLQYIPRKMRRHPKEWVLVLCSNGNRMVMENFTRLSEFAQYLNGVQAELEIFEPGMCIQDTPFDLVNDFRVHARNGN